MPGPYKTIALNCFETSNGFAISSHLLMYRHALSRHVLAWATKITQVCRMLKPRHLGTSRIGEGRYTKSVYTRISVSAASGWDFS
eukprot:Skav201777  [mRNA]  locus=scaffold2375:46875:47129:+ [translate_table: standard]